MTQQPRYTFELRPGKYSGVLADRIAEWGRRADAQRGSLYVRIELFREFRKLTGADYYAVEADLSCHPGIEEHPIPVYILLNDPDDFLSLPVSPSKPGWVRCPLSGREYGVVSSQFDIDRILDTGVAVEGANGVTIARWATPLR
jgi:hypothetical protein